MLYERSIDIRETSSSRKTPGHGEGNTQTGHVHQSCEDNGERQAKTRATEGRNEEEGKSMARGGRKEILVSSDNQTQKARTKGPTYHPKIPPDLSSSKPPSPSFFFSLTLNLPQSPLKSTPFYPCKAFPLCGFWCWPGVLFNVFSIMLWGTCLFSFILTTFLEKNRTSLSASRADYLRRQLVLVPLDTHLKVLI